MPRRGVGRPRVKTRPADAVPTLLGARVRDLRLEREMTQRQLSDASGVSAVFLGVLERGEKDSSLSTLLRVAAGLEVPLVDLFEFGAAANPPQRARSSRADRLGLKVATLALRASPEALTRFERVAEILLAPEGGRPHRRPKARFTPRRKGTRGQPGAK